MTVLVLMGLVGPKYDVVCADNIDEAALLIVGSKEICLSKYAEPSSQRSHCLSGRRGGLRSTGVATLALIAADFGQWVSNCVCVSFILRPRK